MRRLVSLRPDGSRTANPATTFRCVITALAVGLAITGVTVGQSAAVVATEEAPVEERYLEFYNTHTRETLKRVYKRGAEFDEGALQVFNNILRDRRNGDVHQMDARLFDQLFELARAAGVEPHFEIISGYRSQESNDKMSARPGSGVAKKSLHMQGRAIDVRLRNCPTSKLRDLALAARQGGVGYYQRSDFVHIDTGNFRTWTE